MCIRDRIRLGSVRDIDDSPFVRLAVLGNPNLKPATSENISLGFVWNVNKELNLTIDYWAINYKDRIEAESAQALLNTNPYATNVTRTQFGELIAVSTSYFNEEKTEINGIDAEINFFKVTRYGDFNYSIKATQFSEFLTPEDHNAGAHGEQSIMVNLSLIHI